MSVSSNKIFPDRFNAALRDAKKLSRVEAAKVGQLVYFSEAGCEKDSEHVWRYTSNGKCATCQKRNQSNERHLARSAANQCKNIDPEKRKAIDRLREEKALRDELSDLM